MMYVTHPLIKPDAVKLRRYQETVFSRAIEANTLVVLPTGLGKTVIAAMVVAQRLYNFKESKVLFLAPTRPLTVQHWQTFKGILSVDDTVVITGMNPVRERDELWKNNRIIFATPQTIENDIMRGLDLSDVSLVIFDEAHRAVGDYSYIYIAREYMKKSKNPLILGLTASPSSEKEKVDDICRNLFIKQIEAKTEHDVDVKPYIQEVETQWIKVELPAEFQNIKNMMEDLLRDNIRELKELGCLESANIKKINKRTLLKIQSDVRKEIISGIDSYRQASVVASAIKINHGLELLETQGIWTLDEYLDRLSKQKSKAVRKLMSDPRMLKIKIMVHDLRISGIDHPKLNQLVDIVKKHKNERILIFTQYRDSVDRIIDRLNENDILAHGFIGQADRDKKKGMTQKEQIKALENFRNGAYTALIATSVAEEGLDIPKVDLVIFYEPIPSEIRSIQRRGRTGRSATGKVVVLMAKGTRDESYYWVSVYKERKMTDIVRDMRNGAGQKSLIEYDAGDLDTTAIENQVTQQEIASDIKGFGQQSIKQFGTKNGDEIKIIVDVRERNSNTLKILREKANVEIKQIQVGDYILSDRVCVERKTVDDFLQSIVDKRLFEQAADMKRNFEIPIIIIEGSRDMYSGRDIHPNAIRGALVSLAIDFGISVIPSLDGDDTANLLYAIAKREQIEEDRIVILRGEKKPLSLRERQIYVIESLPNVLGVLARRLLEHFGSVENVINASEKELMSIEGIGEKKAAEIKKIVKSRYDLLDNM